MTKKTLKSILRNGGATLDKNGRAADIRGGYMVSRKGGYIIPLDRFNKISRAITKTMAALRPFEFCGLWVNDGRVFIDISVNIKQLAHAQRFGAVNEQLKIWDVKNGRELDCIIL